MQQTVYLEIDVRDNDLKVRMKGASDSLHKFGEDAEKAGSKSEKAFDKTSKSVDTFSKTVKEATKLVAGLFTISKIKDFGVNVLQTADKVKNMEARLRIVTENQKQFNLAQSETKRIADGTYTSVDATVKLYSRLALSLQELGVSQKDVLVFTETLNKSLAISGATGHEAQSVMIQLSQALASGYLRGQEFNSIAEGGIEVQEALKTALGKTTGELRAMANAGELTSDVVFKAVLQQADEVAAKFANFPVTVSRSLELLGNSWIEFIKNSETAKEISDATSKAIQFLAENIDEFVSALVIAAEAAIAFAGAKALGAIYNRMTPLITALNSATKATYRYNTATQAWEVSATRLNKSLGLLSATAKGLFGFLKSNAIGLAIFGGIELISYLSQTNEELEALKFNASEVSEALSEVFYLTSQNQQSEAISALNEAIDQQKIKLQELNSERRKMLEELEGATELLDPTINPEGYEPWEVLNDSIQKTEDSLRDYNEFQKLVESDTGGLAETVKELSGAYQTAGRIVDIFGLKLPGVASAQQVLSTEINANKKEIEAWIEKQTEANAALELSNKSFGKGKAELVRLQAEVLKSKKGSEGYAKAIDELTAKYGELLKAEQAMKDSEKQRQEDIKIITELMADYQEAVDPLSVLEEERNAQLAASLRLLQSGTIGLQEHSKNIIAANQAYYAGKKELEEYGKKVKNVDDILEDLGITHKETEKTIAFLEIALQDAFSRGNWERIQLIKLAIEQLKDSLHETAKEAENTAKTIRGIDPKTGKLTSEASFEGLVQQGLTLKEIFASIQESMDGTAEKTLQAVNLALQGAVFLKNIWDSTAGQDGLGRVANTLSDVASTGLLDSVAPFAQAIGKIAQSINSLTGGRLFGTSYETTGSNFSSFVGPGGVGGQTSITQQRERSFFRGTQTQVLTEELTSEVRNALQEIFDSVEQTLYSLSSDLGTNIPQIISGGFFQEFDAEGKLISEYSEIAGRKFYETLAEFGQRLLAENIIAALDTILPQVQVEIEEYFGEFEEGLRLPRRTSTQLIGEASALAEQFRDQGAAALLDFAQFAVAAVQDLQDGSALLETLTGNLEIVQELQTPGESLAAAYSRIKQETELLDQALGVMGQALDLARTEYIQFADAIAQSVGGLERAKELWATFLENFYSPEELLNINLASAQQASAQSLTDLGLDPTTNMQEFRDAFEAVFATLTPAEVAVWLEAGEALYEYNDLLSQQADLLQTALDAFDVYANSLRGVEDDIQNLLGSDFQNTLRNIQAQEAATIRTLNEQAQAAGRAGISEAELGRVHLRTALQTEAAIAQLRAATRDLIEQLYGDDLDNRIAELEAADSRRIGRVGSLAENTYEKQLQLLKKIKDVIDATLLDERLSPLTRTQQLQEGRQQFQELIALARTGDTDALAALPSLYQELLGIGRDVFASGQGYQDLYAELTNALQGLEPVGSPTGGVNEVSMTPSPELAALYAERDARDAAEYAAQRVELATALVDHLNQLATALQVPILELTQSMGVSIQQLVSDLGVNLENISAETVTSLGAISNSLGIELTELADAVGVTIGELADQNSLINDSLESVIDSLPDGIQAQLEPLLRDVETAADGQGQEDAIQALEDVTSNLPLEYRNLLAPYFDDINPVSKLEEQLLIAGRQETILELQRNLLSSQLTTLQNINHNLSEQNNSAGIPSYAVGTAFVPRDTLANIHEGEIIVNRPDADILRKYGISTNSGNMASVVSAINNLTNVTAEIGDRTNDNISNIRPDAGGYTKPPGSEDRLPPISGAPNSSYNKTCTGGIF